MLNPKSDIRNPEKTGAHKPKDRIIFIVGPTASGKSAVAVELAKRINAEIISCDSMQIYRNMGILTSSPDLQALRAVRHHLLNYVPVSEDYNVTTYRRSAIRKIREIIKRGKIPLFVGGTGLYASILIDGIFNGYPSDLRLRNKLCREGEKIGSAGLHDRLKEADPAAAGKIHPNDRKRIIRALEVYLLSGRRISELQQNRSGLKDKYDIRVFGLDMPRGALYKSINKRVEEMFDKGVVDEARKLLEVKLGRTASFAIGLREIKGFLEGALSLEEAMELMKKNTRNYAKRQLTWFRKAEYINWVKASANDSARLLASRILRNIK